ncbi:MAG: rhodanese-like domain-containing protein [Flavobacteriales bacterium]|nr:rhodanese-like domain-containing protein [Flavobacteriales bacterium]
MKIAPCSMRFKGLVSMMFLALTMVGCSKNIYNTSTIQQLEKEAYFAKMAETKNPYVLDVRTKMEHNKEHIDGAVSMSILNSFYEKVELLDTTRTVFLYCETAHRSPFATMKLKQVGFTKIYDLKGGYITLREK